MCSAGHPASSLTGDDWQHPQDCNTCTYVTGGLFSSPPPQLLGTHLTGGEPRWPQDGASIPPEAVFVLLPSPQLQVFCRRRREQPTLPPPPPPPLCVSEPERARQLSWRTRKRSRLPGGLFPFQWVRQRSPKTRFSQRQMIRRASASLEALSGASRRDDWMMMSWSWSSHCCVA